MRLFGLGLLVLLLGLSLGLGGGWLALGRAQEPPPLPEAQGPSLAPPVPVVPVAPVVAPLAAEPEPAPSPPPAHDKHAEAHDAAPAAAKAPAPAEKPGPDPIAISLVPRGPGHFALLDLQAGGLRDITVRQGALTRDGAANWATFAGRTRLTVLKGPTARVELLHLGFDAEARPVVAHIRTTGHAGGEVEGVVPLKAGEGWIGVIKAD